jgi:hypothetical protein
MAPTTLVSFDIENGEKVIDALDKAGKPPKVALWAKLPDYSNWRLILASDQLDQESAFNGYSEVNEILDKAGIPTHRQPSLLLRPMKSPLVEALRKVFAKTAEAYGLRLGGQTFGDKYLEDAFVYRIR